MRGVKKQHLPTKTCVVCGRPMTWRKKWALTWESVRYCGERCRRMSRSAAATRPASTRIEGPDRPRPKP